MADNGSYCLVCKENTKTVKLRVVAPFSTRYLVRKRCCKCGREKPQYVRSSWIANPPPPPPPPPGQGQGQGQGQAA